jgi:hypothetical protein
MEGFPVRAYVLLAAVCLPVLQGTWEPGKKDAGPERVLAAEGRTQVEIPYKDYMPVRVRLFNAAISGNLQGVLIQVNPSGLAAR